MDLVETLSAFERAGWQSVVDGSGRAHFAGLLSDEPMLITPAGVAATRGEVLDRLAGERWAWFRIRAPRVVRLTDEAAVLSYRVIARQDFEVEHQALVASTYVHDGERWRLVVRQHTPV